MLTEKDIKLIMILLRQSQNVLVKDIMIPMDSAKEINGYIVNIQNILKNKGVK